MTPVDGVQEIFEKEGNKQSANPLIFPDDEFTSKCTTQLNPPVESTEEITSEFEDIVSG